MRLLYMILLHLYPSRIRADFGSEMIEVFDEVSAAERQRGAIAYVRFCVREAAGLLLNLVSAENLMKHKRPIVYGSLAGLLIAGAVGAARANRPYISTAVLRVSPQTVSARFVGTANVETDRILPNAIEETGNTANLMSIIKTFNLYAGERRRASMEDVARQMRQAIVATPLGPNMLRVSFSYSDRFVAQKVTADLVARIMSAYTRDRANAAMLTVMFLKDRVELAASEWEANLQRLREAQQQGKPVDRLRLDTDIARQRYEALSQKAAEAEMMGELERRLEGPTLEVLDPASLSSESSPSPYVTGAAGALTGAVIGFLISWVFAFHLRPAVVQG